MRKISVWANHHPWSSRILIIVSFIILNVLGFTSGIMLRDIGITLPLVTLILFACLYAIGFIAYPYKNKKGKYRMTASTYFRQKTCDMLLASSTYLMIVYLGNHREMLFQYSLPFNQASANNSIFPKDSAAKSYKSIIAFNHSLKDENGNVLKWKERKHLLKDQVRAIKKDEGLSNGAKTGLIILSVLVALGLLYLVAALACNVSCGGSDAGAILVAVGGTALVVFLLILAIRGISGKHKQKNKTTGNKKAIHPEISIKPVETS